jgi:signal-transduction protein with cAMP-binding, CBS, and nucleotidyltransferase domain
LNRGLEGKAQRIIPSRGNDESEMPKAFDAENPPFDRPTPHEIETLRAAFDIAYFRPGEAVIERDTPADALYVVIKGTIEERDVSDLLARLSSMERDLLRGRGQISKMTRVFGGRRQQRSWEAFQ